MRADPPASAPHTHLVRCDGSWGSRLFQPGDEHAFPCADPACDLASARAEVAELRGILDHLVESWARALTGGK
jgi:hypothetical protein